MVYSDASGTGAIVQMGTLNVLLANASQFQRYINTAQYYDTLTMVLLPTFHLISSPLSNLNSYNFTNNNPTVFLSSYIESSDSWSSFPVNNLLAVGNGYKLNDDAISNFTLGGGVFNKGNKTLPLQYSGVGRGKNLIGNPYPCRLDLHNSNSWTKTNVDNSIQTWNPSTNNYESWNGTVGTGILSNGILAETQGFFVQASGAAPSITIPASAQTADSSNNFKSFIPNKVSLTVKGNNSSDNMIVYFNPAATTSFDHQYDVEKEYGNFTSPQLFSITPNNVLSINCLPEVNSTVTVPVGLKVGANTNYTITASDIESFNTSNVYLEDLKLNKMINLNEKATYTFDANTNDVVNRFMLHFGNPTSTN
ncbi:MAG: hypothetical protein WCH34_10080, partial [Bacteroidota bacterium]